MAGRVCNQNWRQLRAHLLSAQLMHLSALQHTLHRILVFEGGKPAAQNIDD